MFQRLTAFAVLPSLVVAGEIGTIRNNVYHHNRRPAQSSDPADPSDLAIGRIDGLRESLAGLLPASRPGFSQRVAVRRVGRQSEHTWRRAPDRSHRARQLHRSQ